MIRRAVNIMSVAEKTCIKVDTFGSTNHQSLLHRSHAPYQAPPHKDTVELLL